jgi:hypothetical protein
MSTSGAYSVVKFVPDRVRFEPVNIGLVIQAGHQLITRMSKQIDPRIRLADPYAHMDSLKDFLDDFDAAQYATETKSAVEWLHANGLPNIYFSAPAQIDVSPSDLDALVNSLFDRIVARSFERPSEWVSTQQPSAARTALRSAFHTAKVLNKKVKAEVAVKGASGFIWKVDFRYATGTGVNLVQAATTAVREDVRRKEHAYEAFATLIDTTKGSGAVGILAVDAPGEDGPSAVPLALMTKGHGLRFIAGQKEFYDLAEEIRRTALPITRDPNAKALEQLLLKT